jgi:hypothetical protein
MMVFPGCFEEKERRRVSKKKQKRIVRWALKIEKEKT